MHPEDYSGSPDKAPIPRTTVEHINNLVTKILPTVEFIFKKNTFRIRGTYGNPVEGAQPSIEQESDAPSSIIFETNIERLREEDPVLWAMGKQDILTLINQRFLIPHLPKSNIIELLKVRPKSYREYINKYKEIFSDLLNSFVGTSFELSEFDPTNQEQISKIGQMCNFVNSESPLTLESKIVFNGE